MEPELLGEMTNSMNGSRKRPLRPWNILFVEASLQEIPDQMWCNLNMKMMLVTIYIPLSKIDFMSVH